MIRLLLLCWLLFGGVACAYANLGDTYEISCQRYGPGHVDGDVDNGDGYAVWSKGPFFTAEYFIKGRCDAVFYTKARDVNNEPQSFTELEVTNFLATNAHQGQRWKEEPSPMARWFYTTDKDLIATLFIEPKSGDQCLLVATAEWANKQHEHKSQ